MNWLDVNLITDWQLKQSVVGAFHSVNEKSYLYHQAEEEKNLCSG